MRYSSQRVAYAYFVVAMLLFGLQVAFAGGDPGGRGLALVPVRPSLTAPWHQGSRHGEIFYAGLGCDLTW